MEVGEPVGMGMIGESKVHAIISLKELTFSGNHLVDKDTRGIFSPPEWVNGRDTQWPICYTRNKNIKLKAKFEVIAPPTATESVKVKGVVQLGQATLEWSGSVSVSPGSKEVTTGELTSSAPLPNYVACFDPMTIQWEAEPPGDFAYLAGASSNTLYVTLGDPTDTPAYWTLLDISCRAAHGATAASGLIRNGYSPFTSRALTRMRDGRGLTYWNPTTTRAMNTEQLLARGDGSGQCGSWSHFLIDMYKCHGLSAYKIIIYVTEADWLRSFDEDPEVARTAAGFLVKNWRFVGKGKFKAPWTHVMHIDCEKMPGIPGQRNDNPPPAFFNHFIVLANNEFYDPSYGGGPIANQDDWENGAIDGLFRGSFCGFPKSRYSNRRLVQFDYAR